MDEAEEFLDWEVLQNSETGVVISSDSLRDFEGIEGDSEGVVRSDYFSLDSENQFVSKGAEPDDLSSEEGSADSDNPSWIEPRSESRYENLARNEVGCKGFSLKRKNSGVFWSDSSSDGSVSQKVRDFEGNHDLGCGDDVKRGLGFEGIGETENFEVKSTNFGEFQPDLGRGTSVQVKFGGIEGENNSDLGEDRSEIGESTGFVERDAEENPEEDKGNVSAADLKSTEGEKRGMIWWKLPLEILKFCVFRVSPVWTISIAAMVMGFVILKKRLLKTRGKSQSIPLKIAFEGKKVSQFMTRAARLNEAFSVVRRVPIIRPSLPVAGATPWPSTSLR